MKNWKSIVSLILSFALLVSFAGCRAGNPTNTPDSGNAAEDATHETGLAVDPVPDITLDPGETDETTIIDDGSVKIPIGEVPGDQYAYSDELMSLRVQDIDQDTFEALIYRYQNQQITDLPVIHLRDTGMMRELLTTFGSETLTDACAGYDQDFFAMHDLLIIPRLTNTGSARHTAVVYQGEGGVVVELSVEVPEIATADMAQWCLMLVVSKEYAEQGVSVVMNGGAGSGIIIPVPDVNK